MGDTKQDFIQIALGLTSDFEWSDSYLDCAGEPSNIHQ
jgi:hypothetical protein